MSLTSTKNNPKHLEISVINSQFAYTALSWPFFFLLVLTHYQSFSIQDLDIKSCKIIDDVMAIGYIVTAEHSINGSLKISI